MFNRVLVYESELLKIMQKASVQASITLLDGNAVANFKTLTQISLDNVNENEKETTAPREGTSSFFSSSFCSCFLVLFFLLFMFEWLKSLNSGKMATLIKNNES